MSKPPQKPKTPASAEDRNEPETEKPLTAEVIASHISLLARTGNGLSHAYTRLEIHGKGLTNIDILRDAYPHLRYLDLSENFIRDISCLQNLEYLLSVNFHGNSLKSIPAALEKRKYLQQCNFSNNKIESVDVSGWPLCSWLNLSSNRLTRLSLAEFPELKHLEVRGNQLTTTAGLNAPTIRNLYMGANVIQTIAGLEDKQFLEILHLRDNRVERLDGFAANLKALHTVNLRRNKIAEVNELDKLGVLPNLKNLVLSENPISELETYRLEVISRLPNLEKLDKDPINQEEREEAEQLKAERAEKARAEEESAKAADEPVSGDGEENVEDGGKDDE